MISDDVITYMRFPNAMLKLVPELRELRQLRDENKRLNQLVGDLSLDKTILQEAIRKEKNGKAGAGALHSGT